MKRTKKILVGFLAALYVLCSSFGLAACVLANGVGTQSSSNKDSSSVSSEEESSSQGGGNTDEDDDNSGNGGNGGGSGNGGTVDDDPISDYDDIISDGDLRG